MYEKYISIMKEEALIRNRSAGTISTYEWQVGIFLKWANKPVEELTLEDARNFIIEKRKNNSSTSYCNGINSALRFFYKYALHMQWDDAIVPRMRIDRRLPKSISIETVESLIDVAQTVRNKAIIALLYSSGLRVGELCNLRPEDIYMSSMQVHIRDGKNHCDHWTILSKRALDLLIEYWRSNPVKREFLFVSERRPYKQLKTSGVESMMKKVGADVGIYLHPHLLRHSFATHMIEQGVSVEYVQAMLGHSSPNSTSVYIHVSNKAYMGVTSPLDHPTPKKRGRKKKNG